MRVKVWLSLIAVAFTVRVPLVFEPRFIVIPPTSAVVMSTVPAFTVLLKSACKCVTVMLLLPNKLREAPSAIAVAFNDKVPEALLVAFSELPDGLPSVTLTEPVVVFTISATKLVTAKSEAPATVNVALSATTGIMFANPVTYLYSCTQTYDPNQVTITQANVNLTSSPSSIRIDNLTSDFVVTDHVVVPRVSIGFFVLFIFPSLVKFAHAFTGAAGWI